MVSHLLSNVFIRYYIHVQQTNSHWLKHATILYYLNYAYAKELKDCNYEDIYDEHNSNETNTTHIEYITPVIVNLIHNKLAKASNK